MTYSFFLDPGFQIEVMSADDIGNENYRRVLLMKRPDKGPVVSGAAEESVVPLGSKTGASEKVAEHHETTGAGEMNGKRRIGKVLQVDDPVFPDMGGNPVRARLVASAVTSAHRGSGTFW